MTFQHRGRKRTTRSAAGTPRPPVRPAADRYSPPVPASARGSRYGERLRSRKSGERKGGRLRVRERKAEPQNAASRHVLEEHRRLGCFPGSRSGCRRRDRRDRRLLPHHRDRWRGRDRRGSGQRFPGEPVPFLLRHDGGRWRRLRSDRGQVPVGQHAVAGLPDGLPGRYRPGAVLGVLRHPALHA